MTVRILVDYELRGEPHRDYATTLGAGGLFIECPDPPLPNSTLKLRFGLRTAGKPFELEGRVTWRCTAETAGLGVVPGMGLSFAPGSDTGRLARELNRLDSSEPPAVRDPRRARE